MNILENKSNHVVIEPNPNERQISIMYKIFLLFSINLSILGFL